MIEKIIITYGTALQLRATGLRQLSCITYTLVNNRPMIVISHEEPGIEDASAFTTDELEPLLPEVFTKATSIFRLATWRVRNAEAGLIRHRAMYRTKSNQELDCYVAKGQNRAECYADMLLHLISTRLVDVVALNTIITQENPEVTTIKIK